MGISLDRNCQTAAIVAYDNSIHLHLKRIAPGYDQDAAAATAVAGVCALAVAVPEVAADDKPDNDVTESSKSNKLCVCLRIEFQSMPLDDVEEPPE